MEKLDDIDRISRSSAPLDLRHLATFRAVALELSFTRAAGNLNYVQSTVTGHVHALERSLGVVLFDRLGRKVKLTEHGMRLLGYANRMLMLQEEVRDVLSGDHMMQRTLTIGAPDTLCAYRLPDVLSAFRRELPSVRVVVRPARSSHDACRSVTDASVDIALLLDHRPQVSGLISEQLATEPLCVLVTPDHPLAGEPDVRLDQFQGLPMVLTESGCGYRERFEQLLVDAGVTRGTTVEFASIEAVKACVKAGMGLTVLPRVAVAADLNAGELVALKLSGPNLSIATQAIWHPDKHFSVALTAFMGCVREVFRGSTTSSPQP